MLPGPMPIFTASAPASISASAPSGVATLPAITWTALDSTLDRRHRGEHSGGMAVRGIDHDHVDPGADQRTGAQLPVRPDPGGRGDAQPAHGVLVGERVRLRLVHVLDGDQADAAIGLVDHQQLLDAMAVQQAAGLLRVRRRR